MKKVYILLLVIILSLFLLISCTPSVVPTPAEGEGEGEGEGEEEATGDRVVLMELFNADGCKASALINPIAENLAESYGTDKVVLIEGAAWGKYTTSEVQERFDWYIPGTKHTPFIAFDGLSQTFSEGIVGGGGGGGGYTPPANHAPTITSTPITIATIGTTYTYDVQATDADGNTLNYNLTTKPTGMTINSATGEISWVPTISQMGDNDVVVNVSDGKLSDNQTFTIKVQENREWTIMIYDDGDNNLEYYSWENLENMENVTLNQNIHVVMQYDPYDDCPGTYRYYITGEAERGTSYPYYPDDIVEIMDEQDMADPSVLTDFINWSTLHYPAEHYVLILRNHGGGWREEILNNKGIIWDDTNDSFFTMAELAQGLDGANEHIDILGFDACGMQMLEVAYTIKEGLSDVPDYLVASEGVGWTPVWPYGDILDLLTNTPTTEETVLCQAIVDGYISNLAGNPNYPATLSVLDLSVGNILLTMNAFANALISSTFSSEIENARTSAQSYYGHENEHKDLYDFASRIYSNVTDCQSEAQAVMDLVDNLVIYEDHANNGVDDSHGLAIFLPDNPGFYDDYYNSLQFANDSQWDEFLLTGGGTVSDVSAIAWTYRPSKSRFMDMINELEDENIIPENYEFVEYAKKDTLETYHAINLKWRNYYGFTGYEIYRSVNDGAYNSVYDWQATPGYSWYGIYDYDVVIGNKYSYYVIAYGSTWETAESNHADIDTFLPVCSLISPVDVTVNDPNPAFTWSPVGLSSGDFPYGTSGTIKSGNSNLTVWSDYDNGEKAWDINFDDMITSQANYNQNGTASPLITDQSYLWESRGFGYDNSGNIIAISWSGNWDFTYQGTTAKDWTVMIYMDGDNNLDTYTWDDLSEMESVGSSAEINIITQLDIFGNGGTYRYYVNGAVQGSSSPYYSADIVSTLSEQDMADPNVLSDFIDWATTNYPAEKYFLVLWNHGAGWRMRNISEKGLLSDETSSSIMTMAELVQGLENIDVPIDVIGFDACLMQMTEVVAEIGLGLTNPPDYIIGSEESEWAYGWPYDDILQGLTLNPTMQEADLCDQITSDYIASGFTTGTLSAFYGSDEFYGDLYIFNNFANALMYSNYQNEINIARLNAQHYSSADYKDLYDFAYQIYNTVPDCQSQADEVMRMLNICIISNEYTGSSVEDSHGLSIYLPDTPANYDTAYDALLFSQNTTWDEYLQYEP